MNYFQLLKISSKTINKTTAIIFEIEERKSLNIGAFKINESFVQTFKNTNVHAKFDSLSRMQDTSSTKECFFYTFYTFYVVKNLTLNLKSNNYGKYFSIIKTNKKMIVILQSANININFQNN